MHVRCRCCEEQEDERERGGRGRCCAGWQSTAKAHLSVGKALNGGMLTGGTIKSEGGKRDSIWNAGTPQKSGAGYLKSQTRQPIESVADAGHVEGGPGRVITG
jgi:hypothetical protein